MVNKQNGHTKKKKISREFFQRYDQLLEEGFPAGAVVIMHCAECKGEIEFRGECTVGENLTITVDPGTFIEGRCGCSTWQIEEQKGEK